jgi:hypothetical protein
MSSVSQSSITADESEWYWASHFGLFTPRKGTPVTLDGPQSLHGRDGERNFPVSAGKQSLVTHPIASHFSDSAASGHICSGFSKGTLKW